MRYLIEHETRLHFPKPVREHQCELRLAPGEGVAQRVTRAEVEVEPAAELHAYVDCFGNRVHHLGLVAPHDRLVTRLSAEVETLLANPFDYAPLPPAQESAWLAQRLRDEPPLWDFVLHRSAAVPVLDAGEAGLLPPRHESGRSLVDSVGAVMHWIADEFRHRPGATDVHGALAGFVESREGVCQDFAHLLIAVVRGWRVPARYVMGYLDPGYAGLDAGAGEAPDAREATHAWAEVLIPGAGWRGFDATHRLVANDTYVTVAVGRDSRDAAPVRGSFKGDHEGESPEVSLRVLHQPQ